MVRNILLVLLISACGDNFAPPTGDMTFEVTRYNFEFDLSSRIATATLSLHVTQAGNCATLPFRAKVPTRVTFAGAPGSGKLAGDELTICGEGIDADSDIEVSATAEVPLATLEDSQVGYSITPDREGESFYYMVSWIGGCNRFAPCDNAPNRFAHYRFSVTHSPELTVLCPGVITAKTGHTICEFDLAGGPTYSTFGLMASPSWQTQTLGTWGGVKGVLYDMPTADFTSDVDGALVGQFLMWMAEKFGPYPYGDELRLVVAPTYWSGFEHPGTITLSDELNRRIPGQGSAYADQLHHTIFHEIAHQWAGDQTTLSDTYDFVWKEAMAEYLAFVFEDEVLGTGTQTAQAWKRFAQGAQYHPVPEDKPKLFDYYGDVYGAGPLVLFRQTESLFGRAKVMAALRTLLGQERAISVADVIAALEQTTAQDLTEYAQAWIYGDGAPTWPQYKISITWSGMVNVTQVNANKSPHGCKFDIRLTGDRATDVLDVPFDFSLSGTISALSNKGEPAFLVRRAIFDPNATCLGYESTAALTKPQRINPWVAR